MKRTALGRFAHEGAWFAPADRRASPLVCYSGDDSQNEYIYKFVSREPLPTRPPPTGSLLDEGTLYVARFNADGTGDWLALDVTRPDFRAADAARTCFRRSRPTSWSTPASPPTWSARPRWTARNGAPSTRTTGEVYFTLTNNSRRTAAQVDAANPRGPNPFGQIVRWREPGNDAARRASTGTSSCSPAPRPTARSGRRRQRGPALTPTTSSPAPTACGSTSSARSGSRPT